MSEKRATFMFDCFEEICNSHILVVKWNKATIETKLHVAYSFPTVSPADDVYSQMAFICNYTAQ